MGFTVGKMGKDMGWICAARQHIEDVFDADAEAANAWPPPENLGINRYALQTCVHRLAITANTTHHSLPMQDSRKVQVWASARHWLPDAPGSARGTPRRPARSCTYCQATRPEREPRVVAHSSASRRRSSAAIGTP